MTKELLPSSIKAKIRTIKPERQRVTEEDKENRAEEIAEELCRHSEWLTHGRSIKIEDLSKMKLLITDYSENPQLNDVIQRYYAVLRMTFEGTQVYKIFETANSQIMRFISPPVPAPSALQPTQKIDSAKFSFTCPSCSSKFLIQANIELNVPLEKDAIEYPLENNIFVCPKCSHQSNLLAARLQIEAQTGKKIVK